MNPDKKTIGIAASNASALANIASIGRFASELDAAKFAMAYAIKEGVSIGSFDSVDTKWNVGSFDPDGSMRSLLEALFPDTNEPYRLAESLMNEGIKHLDEALSSNGDFYETLFSSK
jgi:hypothetical protein